MIIDCSLASSPTAFLAFMMTRSVMNTLGAEPTRLSEVVNAIANDDLSMEFDDASEARGVYVFEDDFTAQLYSCRFALQMSALGVSSIDTDIVDVGADMYADLQGRDVELLFSPVQSSRYGSEFDELVA